MVNFSEVESVLEEGGEFEAVQGERADGGRGGGVATGVERKEAEDFRQLRRDVGPRAHVLRFFLTPEHAGAGVVIGELREAVAVERVELLDAHDRGVGDLLLGAIVDEIVVNFAGAEDDARRFLGRGRVVDDLLESTRGEFVEFLDGDGIAQEGFRRHAILRGCRT